MARTPRSIETARANLEASIPTIGTRYAAGVAGADWQGPAASEAAETNWAAGVSAAVSAKSRQAGVMRVTNSQWQQAAKDKGAAVIGERLRGSLNKWASNFKGPYDAAVAVVKGLPPRTLDPMANIDARLKPVAMAFHDNRVRGRA